MSKDFSENLRGKSFQGTNLTNYNFDGADIRGANFKNCILIGTNFCNTTSGLQLFKILVLLGFSLLFIFLAGVLFGLAGIFAFLIPNFDENQLNLPNIISNIFILISFLIFIIITLWKDFLYGFFIGILVLTPSFLLSLQADAKNTVIQAFFIGSTVLSLSVTSWITISLANAVILIIISYSPIVIFASLTITLISAKTLLIPSLKITESTIIILSAAIISILGSYIASQALTGGDKFGWIKKIAVFIAATGGTSFYGADLTDADFTGAILKNTDFRTANLTRTRFHNAKKLDFARPGNTILANSTVLNLLVTLNGIGKSYPGANLKGANLKDAKLQEANLKEAHISEATFQEAGLEGANLTLTQAIGTNFTKAKITGACVEAWNIDSSTILDNVNCRFVYLLEYPKLGTDDRECRPSSGEFKEREFTKLFEKVLNTVDLIFRNSIDWKAFLNAFGKVQVKNQDTELTIQSIENKGDGVVIIKVAVPENADKEKIHSDFFQEYQSALKEVEKYKELLEENREKYSDMKNIVHLLAEQKPSIQVINTNHQEQNDVTNSNNDSSRKVEIGSIGRDFNASGQALNLGEISGTVTNTINELPPAPKPEKPGIKEILTQLQKAIEADTDLTAKDKEKALKQVKALAEAAQNPQEKEDLADTAITMLKGVLSNLPTAAKLVEECSKLLPLISGFLGLG